MLALLATLLLAAEPADPAEPAEPVEPVEAVTPDGGQVPIISPQLTPKLAPVLAPELAPDGGSAPVVVPPSLSVYDVDRPFEATVTGGSILLFVMLDLLIKPTLEGDISCQNPVGNGRCDPADLWPIDRAVVGKSSSAWKAFGDLALYTSMVAPAIYLGLESFVLPTEHPVLDWADDLLVIGEAIALVSAVNVVLKFAVRRPRPARYLPDIEGPLSTYDQELSFPSGHTSVVAASTTALTTTIFLRHPESRVRFVVMGSGMLLTAATAISRVESGNHFPTDVIVGALVGTLAGFTVPYLHRKDSPVIPSASFNPATGESVFGLGGTF